MFISDYKSHICDPKAKFDLKTFKTLKGLKKEEKKKVNKT